MVAQQGQPEPPVLLLLRVVCSDRAAAVVAEAKSGLVVLEAQEVEDLAAAVAVLAAAHTQQVLAGLAAMAGHWYWSSDDGQIRYC